MDCLNPESLDVFRQTVSAERRERLFVDAGISHLRLRVVGAHGNEVENEVIASNRDLKTVFDERHLLERFGAHADAPIFITGKLSSVVKESLGTGFVFLDAAVKWLAAQNLQKNRQKVGEKPLSLAVIEISASGYSLIGLDGKGELKDDLLAVNPRCGAGTGINLDRVLQKLGLKRHDVDGVLCDYLGDSGRKKREQVNTRADRCGVFGASATISDKNQGIPLDVALATTLKSEVLKVCHKLPAGFEQVLLTGRFFYWQFVRDCAEDYLRSLGVRFIDYDPENTEMLDALFKLVDEVGVASLIQPDSALLRPSTLNEFPDFSSLHAKYSAQGDARYCRESSPEIVVPVNLDSIAVHIGLDVGSTMAKVVMADDENKLLFVNAFSNAGDTIETVRKIFAVLFERGIASLQIRSIGITGSARYQVQEALCHIYPHLVSRIAVLVENYAHARGSIDHARAHVERLKAQGVSGINEDLCILVDIGGEDTKISSIALKEAELFNNAMNIKCSAGTGSLMDTLSALFDVPGPGAASQAAMRAKRSFEINATCAVFLMENAQKLQAQGVARDEILASANWAIVENMARTLWSQVELPSNCVVLLHGQTMLSDPLPLAVTHRLQNYLKGHAYSLVPPYPGHRACLGLIRTLRRSSPEGTEAMALSTFLEAKFQKRIIQCKGAACDDPQAVCNRTSLKCNGAGGKPFTFTLGGCSAINELFAKAKDRKSGKVSAPEDAYVKDAYKEIWDYIDSMHPKSDAPNRLVIPRSFVVSEWAYFLSQIFVKLGIEVHVDNVRDADLNLAQPQFDIDSCAPHMGAVGQFTRLAGQGHGYILAPQIEKLPTDGKSRGQSCTLNQAGVAVASGVAQSVHPDAKFHLFHLDLSTLDAGLISDQIYERLQPIFSFYQINPSRIELFQVIQHALQARATLREKVADLAADFIEEALLAKRPVALVLGREYLLNPGIYDSHVRRLLRDKHMLAIPSYVLDIRLEESFSHIYWRNPHLFSTILYATASKKLHEYIMQPRLAALFRQIESGKDLLPVVEISTFCCGPDSVTLPLAAELMKKRPFLLIQSDAIIKELAHLENRVNTYVRQLELGLHDRLKQVDDRPFEIATLDSLEFDSPLDPKRDVIYIPTLADNRVLTTVLRSAGFTCIDNYQEGFNLEKNIKNGRRFVGDTVCAPMAGVFSDLLRACDDFAKRKQYNDPLVADKTRLLFFDNAGNGPCRQGQYVEMHKLTFWRNGQSTRQQKDAGNNCRNSADAALRFLVARETEGYAIGVDQWTMLRLYQGVILQGVLQDMHFKASTVCATKEEYQRFHADFLKMKDEVYSILESTKKPSLLWRLLTGAPGIAGALTSYYVNRLDGKDVVAPIRRFAATWFNDQNHAPDQGIVSIHATGEVYMRVAMAEEVFRTLLSNLGFGHFKLEVAPVWAYFDYMIEEMSDEAATAIKLLQAKAARGATDQRSRKKMRDEKAKLKRANQLRWALRNLVATPLYRAAGLPVPRAAIDHMKAAEEVLPTHRPQGELAPYLGEVLMGLREDSDLFINIAPTGCMVSSSGQVLSQRLRQLAGDVHEGRIQHLFSADGEIDAQALLMALLKRLGPEKFFVRQRMGADKVREKATLSMENVL